MAWTWAYEKLLTMFCWWQWIPGLSTQGQVVPLSLCLWPTTCNMVFYLPEGYPLLPCARVHFPLQVRSTIQMTQAPRRIQGQEKALKWGPHRRRSKESGKKVNGDIEQILGTSSWWFLIPYLAQLAKEGLKADKTFKQYAFSMAVCAINQKFGTNFEHQNVSNHYWSLKTRLQDMCSCFVIQWCRLGWGIKDHHSRPYFTR